jgi:hypothetical protein
MFNHMAKTNSVRATLIIVFAATTFVASASPQEAAKAAGETHSSAETESTSGERSKLPEAEFVGSPSFRSASLVQPLWRDLNAEGHYFGGNGNNIGFGGGSWTFHGESWKLAPGIGVLFGNDTFRTMPGLTLRWEYEHKWFITEGLLVQGLLHTTFASEETELEEGNSADKSVVPFIGDGNHVSARWKGLTAGGVWEHMQFREGNEWKGGVRVAYKVFPALSFTFFAMGPGGEIRGGVLFQPEEKK